MTFGEVWRCASSFRLWQNTAIKPYLVVLVSVYQYFLQSFCRATSYKGTDGASCTKTANTAVNASASGTCRVYDGHYLVGNYYQWNAATAGTGGTITSSNASGSVCPKGWKLPNVNGITGKGSFRYLLQQYGLASESGNGTLTGTSPVNNNTYNIALSPLFFVRGGFINLGSKDVSPDGKITFYSAGQYGYYWSSRASSNADTAYYLDFGSSSVDLSYGTDRYYGYSLRCLISTP